MILREVLKGIGREESACKKVADMMIQMFQALQINLSNENSSPNDWRQILESIE